MTLPEDPATHRATQHPPRDTPRTPPPPDTLRQPIDHRPTDTAELTALAAHLRRLADHIAELTAAHTTLNTLVTTTLGPELAALRHDSAEQLANHTAQIRQLHATNTAEIHPPVNWPALTAEQALTEWEKLAHWITDVFVPWYQITREQLPDCWALHRPAVLELSWLHTTHLEAFTSHAAPHQAADWHTRWRPSVSQRIQECIPRRGTRYCTPGEHLITPDHQRTTHSIPPPPNIVTPTPTPTHRPPMPSEQLAERHHWQHFYQQALTADLASRQP